MITLKDVIDNLSGCYKTIKINTLAVLESRWTNAITAITFSMDEEKDSINVRQEGEVVIIKAIFPFQQWSQIKEWLREARFKLHNFDVYLSQNLDTGALTCNIDLYAHPEWPAFRYEHNYILPYNLAEKIRIACPKFGYNSVRTLVKYELFVSEWAIDRISSSTISFIEVIIPVYTKIRKDAITLTKDNIEVPIVFHKEVNPLQLNAEYLDKQNRGKGLIKQEISPGESIISEYYIQLNNKELEKNVSLLKLSLLHKQLGILDEQYVPLRDLIIKSGIIRSPLFFAMSIFLQKDKLYQQLMSPGLNTKNKSTKPQDIFEETVCHFLSSAGLSAVYLGIHENLKDQLGNIIGSADILAYDKDTGTLLVISCKISMPDHNSVDKIRSTSMAIKSRLPSFLDVINVEPFIFTTQITEVQKEEAKKFDVTIIDKSALENLFNLAQERTLKYDDLKKL